MPLALLLPPDPAFWLLAGQGMIANFHALVYNITQVTFRQRHTPAHLLGRMNASVRFFVWGVMPIAALLAGPDGLTKQRGLLRAKADAIATRATIVEKQLQQLRG